ncbi:MAG: hypothetical protein K1X94_25490 [Sandaracinaceae bacterium]|nr:hypothetical protein [Sandaracinaceae bacterium]
MRRAFASAVLSSTPRWVVRAWALFALVLGLLALGPTVSQAQDGPDAELSAARELVLHASYRPALTATQRYLERGDLSALQRNAGLELVAIIHLALRDEVSARQALNQLFSRDPDFRLTDPDASPVVLSAVARARAQARPVAVTLAHDPPALSRRRAPLISVHIEEGADAVAEIRMHHRVRGQTNVETVVMRVGELATAEGRLPLTADPGAYTAEYWLEAVAPSGFVLARRGSETQPISLAIPIETVEVRVETRTEVVETQTDIASEPWFWVLIGLVVVGGAGAGVGIAFATQGPQDGSLGTITLPLTEF